MGSWKRHHKERGGGGKERSGLFDGVDKKGPIKYIRITSSI